MKTPKVIFEDEDEKVIVIPDDDLKGFGTEGLRGQNIIELDKKFSELGDKYGFDPKSTQGIDWKTSEVIIVKPKYTHYICEVCGYDTTKRIEVHTRGDNSEKGYA